MTKHRSKIKAICRKKKKYKDFQAATDYAAYLKTEGINVIPYPCSCCLGWHLTRNKPTIFDLIRESSGQKTI